MMGFSESYEALTFASALAAQTKEETQMPAGTPRGDTEVLTSHASDDIIICPSPRVAGCLM